MSRLLLTLGVIAGALAAWVGAVLGGVGGVLIGAGIGLAGALLIGLVQRRRLRTMASAVSRWVQAAGVERDPIPPSPDPDWHRLSRALNVLRTDSERLLEAAVREPTARRHLVESLSAPALLFTVDGNLTASNAAADELFQIPATGSMAAVQVLGSAALAAGVSDVLAGGGARQFSAEIGDRFVTLSVSVLDDEVLVIADDRTEERRVDEVRRNFVVNASHELKTPVTAMKALIDALAVTIGAQGDGTAFLVQRLGEEADRLANLVHDLLDLRRLEETGSIVRVELDLRPLIDGVVAALAAEATTHGVHVEVAGHERAVVHGSRDDLVLAVRNLVANAIGYNRPGGSVTIEVTDGVDEGAIVTVSDTGIGIPRADLSRIFERFYRVEAARSRQTGGTGLGLSIVRHVVERHGGSISVDSLLGVGSTFTVWLPRASATP